MINYNKNLFREFLVYPDYKTLYLFEDKKRYNKLLLYVITLIENYGKDFILNEYKSIIKNFIPDTLEQTKINLNKVNIII